VSLRKALYYPYIHIRSEHWLKATLLCAPAVTRIVPKGYTPEDNAIIAQYSQLEGSQGPLLQSVSAQQPEAYAAQLRLTEKIKADIRRIVALFGRDKAPKKDEYWIHDAKFNEVLLPCLTDNKLAWPSTNSSGFGHRRWFALHPTLGSAIMTTLGLSIARDDHLDIVTPSRQFHERLLTTDEDAVFDALLAKEGGSRIPAAQAKRDLGHLVVVLSGVNFRALRPEALTELHASSHFHTFQKLLRSAAETVERGEGGEQYRESLERRAEEIGMPGAERAERYPKEQLTRCGTKRRRCLPLSLEPRSQRRVWSRRSAAELSH
jgi:hypothetical protein